MNEHSIREIAGALIDKGYVSLPALLLSMLDRILELSNNELIIIESDAEKIEAEITASVEEAQ